MFRNLLPNNRLKPEREAKLPDWCLPIDQPRGEPVTHFDREDTPDWTSLGDRHPFHTMTQPSNLELLVRRLEAEKAAVPGETVTVRMHSIFSHETNEMTLPISQADLDRWRTHGGPIQHAFPHMTDAQREFLLTGSTQEEWDAALGPKEEDDALPDNYDDTGPW